MSAALSRTPAIAVSYGNVIHPTPTELHQPAHNLSVRIVEYLWTNWAKVPEGIRDGQVELYNVNLPMIQKLVDPEGLQVYWTPMWRSSYGRLFKHIPAVQEIQSKSDVHGSLSEVIPAATVTQPHLHLAFKFAPDLQHLIKPDLSVVPVGTDGWAFALGHASITPLRTGFAEADIQDADNPLQVKW
jgi:tubulin---tyrosine ligase